MRRISTATRVTNKFGAGKDGFTNGDPVGGIAATDLEDVWFDHVQEEIATFVEAAGLVLDPANRSQLLAAVQGLFAAKAGNASQVFSVAAPTAAGHATPLGEFAALLAAQGYVKIPVIVSGVKRTLIIQWISAVPAGGGGVFTTLPIAFPNAVLTGFASWLNAGGTNGPAAGGIGNLALGSATLFNNSSFTQNQINGLVIGW